MGDIKVKCACGEEFSVPSGHAGKQLRCKSCGEATTVPMPAGVAPPAPEGRPTFRRDNYEYDDAPPRRYGPQKSSGPHPLIILLIVFAVSVPVLSIIAAIAVPNLIAALDAGSETKVIILLRAMVSAQAVYQISSGNRFASSPTDLSDRGFISCDRAYTLDGGYEGGYSFIYMSDGQTYSVYANPDGSGSATRSFFINESGIVRWIANGNAAQYESGGETWNMLGM